MKQLNKYFLVLVSLLITTAAFCQVRLPKLISNGLVLQRDAKIKIWGWSAPNEKIAIDFINKKYKISANAKGEWELQLPNQKPGGPYAMKIVASNAIEINDILQSFDYNSNKTLTQLKSISEEDAVDI